ncbi:MAG: hypothetical protein ABIV06_07735, partial [Thermoanaerobaculia bacterium]
GSGGGTGGASGAAGRRPDGTSSGTSSGGFGGAAQGLARDRRPGEGDAGEKGWQSLFRLGADGKLARVRVRTGLSDGRFSEVVEGEVAVGDAIVVGLATTKAGPGASGSPLGQGGPGGRRF